MANSENVSLYGKLTHLQKKSGGRKIARMRAPRRGVKRKAESGDFSLPVKRARGSGDYALFQQDLADINGRYKQTYQNRAQRVGRAIGSGLGAFGGWVADKVFGSGDYVVGGKAASIMTNGKELPLFAATADHGGSTFVQHREYLKDIRTGAAGTFNVEKFALQVADEKTFPWLATIAQNFEEYRLWGCIFEFRTTSSDALNSTNTALGTVIMATNYNASRPAFISKQEMENYEFSQSAKPSVSQLHGCELAGADTPLTVYYVRNETLGPFDDIKMYDYGNFQIATSGFQASNVVVGELWVTYNVQFLKPRIPRTIGGTPDSAFWSFARGPTATLNFCGSTGVLSQKVGTLATNPGTKLTDNVMTLAGVDVGNLYGIVAVSVGTGISVPITMSATSGCVAVALGDLNTLVGTASTDTTTQISEYYFQATDTTMVVTCTNGTQTAGFFQNLDLQVFTLDRNRLPS